MIDREEVIKGLEKLCKKSNCPFVCFDALALLKKQEAVKRTSRTGINGFSIIWTCGACGSDLYPNNAKAKYCSNCGQAVKWDA